MGTTVLVDQLTSRVVVNALLVSTVPPERTVNYAARDTTAPEDPLASQEAVNAVRDTTVPGGQKVLRVVANALMVTVVYLVMIKY